MEVLRPDVLTGISVLIAGEGEQIAARCAALGADVARLDADLADEDAVAATIGSAPDVLVCATDDGMTLDGCWNAVRAVANSWIPDRGGKIVLVAPGQGEHHEAAGAALENLARTLSIEWARYGITTTAIRPGGATPAEEVAELAAFLASPAGDYYSGAAFGLR